MKGISGKRLLVTLLFSIVIWLVTIVIQAFDEAPKYIALFTQDDCSATGYPLIRCVGGSELPSYFLNVFFWFWVIHFFIGWFTNRNSSK